MTSSRSALRERTKLLLYRVYDMLSDEGHRQRKHYTYCGNHQDAE